MMDVEKIVNIYKAIKNWGYAIRIGSNVGVTKDKALVIERRKWQELEKEIDDLIRNYTKVFPENENKLDDISKFIIKQSLTDSILDDLCNRVGQLEFIMAMMGG